MRSPAKNLYLCRSRNGKVKETSENAKKCAESGVQSPAANLYLCRSWNSKVEETAENAKNRRRRGCGKKSLELVHRDFYDAFSSRACFCLIKLILQLRHFLLTKLVASLVIFHTRVTFDPVPFHIEGGIEGIKFLP